MKIQYFLRPECGSEDRWGPTFGPFDDFIQLTYGDVQVGPDGETIGGRNHEDGLYYFGKTYTPANEETPIPRDENDMTNCGDDYSNVGFSDVVIWAKAQESHG